MRRAVRAFLFPDRAVSSGVNTKTPAFRPSCILLRKMPRDRKPGGTTLISARTDVCPAKLPTYAALSSFFPLTPKIRCVSRPHSHAVFTQGSKAGSAIA